MPRASHIQKAERLNLARTLLQRYQHWPEAAQQLARKCSISERQAYRYLEQAQRLKHPVPVGDVKVSFTIKLSRRLVERLRAFAASTGLTLSEIATGPNGRQMLRFRRPDIESFIADHMQGSSSLRRRA